MSSKSLNGSVSDTAERGRDETVCLLGTSTADVVENLSDEEKNFKKELSQDDEEKETFEIGEPAKVVEQVVIFMDDVDKGKQSEEGAGGENYEGMDRKESGMKRQNESIVSVGYEVEIKDAGTLERITILAEPEESENENEAEVRAGIVVRENFDSEACEKCVKVLEENAEQLQKMSCSEKLCTLEDLAYEDIDAFDEMTGLKENECKCHNLDLDSSGSFRASVRSLSTCHESVPSARRCPSKRDLYLDLECRICHDAEGQDLISPCHCAGTSKWVHESCIIKWIRHTKTKQCEICTCPITVKRKKKPIDQWTRPSATCGPCNKLDVWYCFVLALCILIIIGFVVLQNHYDVTDQIETTVIFASIYVLCGMIIMMKARYFWTWFVHRSSFWGNWKNLNEEWRIVEGNEANLQSPVSPV